MIDGRRLIGRILGEAVLNALSELSFIAKVFADDVELDDLLKSAEGKEVTFSAYKLLDDPCSDC